MGIIVAVTVWGNPRRSAAPLLFLPRKPQSLAVLPVSKKLANRNFGGHSGASAAIRPPVCRGPVPFVPATVTCLGWSNEVSDKPFNSSILASTRDSLGRITGVVRSTTECRIRVNADDLTIQRGNRGES